MSDYWPDEFLQSLDPGSLGRDDEIAVLSDIAKVRSQASSMGLLVIEDFAANQDFPEFFRDGLKLIVEGTDPEEVFQTLFGQLKSGTEDKTLTMKNALYLQGVLSIQQGESPEETASRIGRLMGLT